MENVVEMKLTRNIFKTEDELLGSGVIGRRKRRRKCEEVDQWKGVAILLHSTDAKTTEQSFSTFNERVGCSTPPQSRYPASTLES